MKQFDLEKLIGANCQLNVVHNAKEIDGEQVTFANITSIVPPSKGATRLDAENYTRRKDRDQQDGQFPPQDQSGQPAPPAGEPEPEFEMQF